MINLLKPLVALAMLGCAAQTAFADNFPSKPIQLIISFPPGGGTDTVARIFAKKFHENTGQPLVMQYKPGAAEQVGTAFAAKAPADGYTVLMIGNSFSINPALYPNLPYDTVKDFKPLALIGIAPFAILGNPDLPAKSLKEFTELVKANPGKYNYGSLGSGSPQQLSMEWYKKLAGIDIVTVPYKGLGPAMLATISGEVQAVVAGLASSVPHIQSGKLRPLAVTTPKRSPAAPDIPTVAESGFPEFATFAWYGLAVPSKTPPEIVEKLNAEFVRAINDPEIKAAYAKIGVEAQNTSVAEFQKFIDKDLALWNKLVPMVGAKPD